MNLSTTGLTLAPNAAIDLQLHTVYSDGSWTDDQLLDYLVAQGFGLAAITDHDRVDTADRLQQLALKKQFPLLAATEMSAMWQEQLTDFLCFGFDPHTNQLDTLAQDITRRQHDNTRQVFNHLLNDGYDLDPSELEQMLMKPAAQQLPQLLALASKFIQDQKMIGKTLLDAGFTYVTHDPATIVEAAHQSGAVCILAHPGRNDGFVRYSHDLLDELRSEAPIDGIEVYYPSHTPEQSALYLDYAQRHDLLVSAGSDSHHPKNPPVKYEAVLCGNLLERLGVQVG